MSKEDTRQGILVELDCLLDTRLGTLARLGDDVAEKTLFSGSYHTREIDLFEHADMKAYKTLYAQRDSITLSKSMPTGIVRLLRQLAAALTDQAIQRPYHSGAKIVVNTYPYSSTLSGEEKDEIQKSIADWLVGSTAIVELTSASHESLTPERIAASNIAAMFMYTPNDWMNAQATGFERKQLPDVSLFGPALYELARPSDEEIAQQIQDFAHPFRALELQAKPLIDLQLLPALQFSILTSRTATGT